MVYFQYFVMTNCYSTQVMGNLDKCKFTESNNPDWNTILSDDVNALLKWVQCLMVIFSRTRTLFVCFFFQFWFFYGNIFGVKQGMQRSWRHEYKCQTTIGSGCYSFPIQSCKSSRPKYLSQHWVWHLEWLQKRYSVIYICMQIN